jgi:hypothetical protein
MKFDPAMWAGFVDPLVKPEDDDSGRNPEVNFREPLATKG